MPPLRLKLDYPNVVDVMRQLGTSAATAQTQGMGDVVDGWKDDIRAVVRANFKRTPPIARKRGLNFEKSFQGTTYPKKGRASYDPAGFLVAKAGFAEVFDQGGQISPRRRRYLDIALPAARKLGLDYGPSRLGRLQKRSLVEEAERRFGPLRPIPSKNGNIVLAVSTAGKIGGGFIAQGGHSRGKVTAIKARGKRRDFIPLFVRVKSVQAPKKIRFLPIAQKWLQRLPAYTEKRAAAIMAKRT